MLTRYSPGCYHYRVPRSRTQNVRFRLFVLRACRKNPAYRKAVLYMCKADILFWINTFVWQYNPNAIGPASEKVGPFITWGLQEDVVRTALDCIEGREDMVIEKSREMGASWLCIIILTWFLLFEPDTAFLCISRNEKAVDDASKNSLFTKIDYILGKLPEWMAEVKPGKINRRVMSFINEANGSEISGQASTRKAGVGGRATAIFVDEFSQIDADWQVLERTANTSGCRIFNGTHMGTNTAFYELTTQVAADGHIRKVVMHWSAHPDKGRGTYEWDRFNGRVAYHDPAFPYPASFIPVTDGSPTGGPYPGLRSPWYDKRVKSMGTLRAVAADLDINPSGSTEQVFDPILVHDLKARFCREPVSYDLEWDKELCLPIRFHPAKEGKFKLWCPLAEDWQPLPGDYCFGADIATGNGATPTCLTGVNARTGEKVLEYVDSRIEPMGFAHLLVAVARMWKDKDGRGAKIAWETPGPGNTVTKHVLLARYSHVWTRKTEHRMKTETSDIPGWPNSPESMRNLIENYRDALRTRRMLNRSVFALSECMAFVYAADGYVYHTGWKDPKDPSAARINHGDRVVADALAWKLVDEWGKLSQATTGEPDYDDSNRPAWMPPRAFDPRSLSGRLALARNRGGKPTWA